MAWKDREYFTYIATEGLPLRAYVATISIKPKSKKIVGVTWQSYLNSKKMSEKQFLEFLVFMGSFYEASLEISKHRLKNNTRGFLSQSVNKIDQGKKYE